MNYSYALLNDRGKFWERCPPQAILLLCEYLSIYLQKPTWYSVLHTSGIYSTVYCFKAANLYSITVMNTVDNCNTKVSVYIQKRYRKTLV